MNPEHVRTITTNHAINNQTPIDQYLLLVDVKSTLKKVFASFLI